MTRKLLLFLSFFSFLDAASARITHQPFLDFIADSCPEAVRKCPQLLGSMQAFYDTMDETFYKAVLDPENAQLYRRIDAEMLWMLLCKENSSLQYHFNRVKRDLQKVHPYVKKNRKLALHLKMEFGMYYCYLGCHLRSLIFGTDRIINKASQSISLSALHEARRMEHLERWFKIPPNSFIQEHLVELIVTHSSLNEDEANVGNQVMESKFQIFQDVRSTFFFCNRDEFLTVQKKGFNLNCGVPEFIRKYTKTDRDIIVIDGREYLNKLGLGAQVFKYWLFLTAFVPSEIPYYHTSLPFSQNMIMFIMRVSRLSEVWQKSGKQREELRNLCCTFDFLYNYNYLLGDKYEFDALKSTLCYMSKSLSDLRSDQR